LAEFDGVDVERARPKVFLSYASGDREAARLLRDTLPAYGLEVWFDESDLAGGEAWDQKIRRQIRDCDYFMPMVSAQTEARREGYFRREWRLAVERTLDMADDHLFLLPVVIDDTPQATARVPEKFLTVQWLKVPAGRPTPALEAMCRRLVAGDNAAPEPASKPRRAERQFETTNAPTVRPVFPVQEKDQKVRFWVEVAGWGTRSLWFQFKRLPRWIRWVAYAWGVTVMISHCSSSKHDDTTEDAPPHIERPRSTSPQTSPSPDTPSLDTPSAVTPAEVEKLKSVSQQYQGTHDKNDLAKLIAAVAKQINADEDDPSTAANKLLALPFTAPPGDAPAAKLADASFAMSYGMIEMKHHGQVGLAKEPLSSPDLGTAVELGKALHSTYVLFGAADKQDGALKLRVKIVKVADGSVYWSRSYAGAGADSAKIAAEINANLPQLTE
jgi:hypothetical protein